MFMPNLDYILENNVLTSHLRRKRNPLINIGLRVASMMHKGACYSCYKQVAPTEHLQTF